MFAGLEAIQFIRMASCKGDRGRSDRAQLFDDQRNANLNENMMAHDAMMNLQMQR